jgi:autonomous glycyl radical cofactor GrcA
VLSRFRGALTLKEGGDQLPADMDWDESISVRLVVNDALTAEQQRLVIDDFDLEQLEAFEIRKALVGYFLQANLLPTSESELNEAKSHPERFPVLAVGNSGESVISYAF